MILEEDLSLTDEGKEDEIGQVKEENVTLPGSKEKIKASGE